MPYVCDDDAPDSRVIVPTTSTRYHDRIGLNYPINSPVINSLDPFFAFAFTTESGPSPKTHPGMNGGMRG